MITTEFIISALIFSINRNIDIKIEEGQESETNLVIIPPFQQESLTLAY